VSDTPKHSVSVAGIVVRDDGRVLAIHRRDNHHWEPPAAFSNSTRPSTKAYAAKSSRKRASTCRLNASAASIRTCREESSP
jgi:hypothetical protein